jgi:hypothetical protein
LDGGTLFVFDQLDRHLGQIAHHRVDVASDVADLGELAGLDLDERRSDELGQPPGDLGLADAGRADEDDVLGCDLVAESRSTCCRRQRLRRAMATARLACT